MTDFRAMPNFSAIIFAIEKHADLHGAQIARRIGVPASTYSSWKNGTSVDPGFFRGVALIKMFEKEVGGDLPTL